MIFLLTVHVILLSMVFQLHGVLFSWAVYIKTQNDISVTILEASNALAVLQAPFWIVCSMRSSQYQAEKSIRLLNL